MESEIKRGEGGRFLPGTAAGPGRPRFSIVSILREELQRVPEGEQEEVARQKLREYVQGLDDVGVRDAMDRFDGKPHQTLTVNNEQDALWLEFLKGVRAESEPEAAGDTDGLLEAEAQTPDT